MISNKNIFKLCLILTSCLAVLSCRNKKHETIGENEFYTCSMDPQVMEKQPGICPICKMPLAKVVIDKKQLHIIKLSEEQLKLGNIKVDTISENQIWNEKTLNGVFTINQTTQQQISSRFNGRIEKLYFKIPGQEIKKGDMVYEVYSRELMQAQEEYLMLIEKSKLLVNSESGLIESAKNKLLLWGLTEAQIIQLGNEKQAKIVNPIYSQFSGTAIEVLFKEGDYIEEGSAIFKLADLTALWVEAQAYSNELDLIEKGAKVQIIPDAFPEEVIDGEIDFSNPELQPQTKINLIRIKVPNTGKKFIPGMMALVSIKTQPKTGLALPLDAVVQNGKRAHVWIQTKPGSFEAREVQTGIQTTDRIEILSGLSSGEAVVTSGAYLIYSDYVFKRGSYPLTTDSNKTKMSTHKDHKKMNM